MANAHNLEKALEQQFQKDVDEQIRKAHAKAETLYHYTGIDSLMGMIESNRLWMSKATFLNDSSELFYIRRVIGQVINNMKTQHEGLLWHKFLDEMENVAEKFFTVITESGFEVYVFSLSQSQDSLALWYNYARGEGYNIGFSAEELLDHVREMSGESNFLHGHVIYSKEEQEEILTKLLWHSYDLVKKNAEDANWALVAEHLFSITVTCAVFFKDPAFKSEEEYRISLLTKLGEERKDVQFRARNGVIIPYVALSFNGKLPISHITIGPKNNIDIAKHGIEHYLKSKGYETKNMKIEKSLASLRY